MNSIFKCENNYISKFLAFVLTIILIYQISFASSVLVDETHHHCERDTSCHVCKTISIAKVYLASVSLSERVDDIFSIGFLLDFYKLAKINLFLTCDTPVSLKVKLLN